MLRICVLGALSGWAILLGNEAAAPEIDKAKLETYIRYVEAYTPQVKLDIDNPTSSPYKGFWRVVVHLSMGEQKLGDRLYYVTADGERFVGGSVWDLKENPYLDTLEHLPSNGASFGPENAKVTIVAFSDFQCPYCRSFAKTVRDNLPKKYPDTVRFVFEDFPINSIHPWARAAAEAAHCVGNLKPTAFWVFHDWIFEHQGEVNDAFERQKPAFGAYLQDKTLAIAKEQGLDEAKVRTCIDKHEPAEEVEQSLTAGRTVQIQQTPTFFINGRMVAGSVDWKTLDAVIQIELNRPKDIPSLGRATPCCEVTVPTIFKK
jgi:protein-disulfide isomerase